jgi:tetratricopeptide (TPR) repeat protein
VDKSVNHCRGHRPAGTLDVTYRDQATATKAKIMIVIWLVVLSVFVLQVRIAIGQTTTQTTTGPCSPALSQVGGNVTINCQGLDEQVLRQLNEFLDKKFTADQKNVDRLHELLDKKDVELQAKISEAEAWAQKYRELEQRLATEGQDSVLAQQAQALIQAGKLDEARVLLERLVNAEEKGVEQVAAHQFNLAEVYALQFQPDKALPHYEKAYRFQPDNTTYAYRYAMALQEQHDFQTAEPIYTKNLAVLRTKAQANPDVYLPEVATTLNNLGRLYSNMRRFIDSRPYRE